MKSIDKAVEVCAQTTRSVLKRNAVRFAAALLVALASLMASPNAALAAAPRIMIGAGLLPTESRRPRSDSLFDGSRAYSIRTAARESCVRRGHKTSQRYQECGGERTAFLLSTLLVVCAQTSTALSMLFIGVYLSFQFGFSFAFRFGRADQSIALRLLPLWLHDATIHKMPDLV